MIHSGCQAPEDDGSRGDSKHPLPRKQPNIRGDIPEINGRIALTLGRSLRLRHPGCVGPRHLIVVTLQSYVSDPFGQSAKRTDTTR